MVFESGLVLNMQHLVDEYLFVVEVFECLVILVGSQFGVGVGLGQTVYKRIHHNVAFAGTILIYFTLNCRLSNWSGFPVIRLKALDGA